MASAVHVASDSASRLPSGEGVAILDGSSWRSAMMAASWPAGEPFRLGDVRRSPAVGEGLADALYDEDGSARGPRRTTAKSAGQVQGAHADVQEAQPGGPRRQEISVPIMCATSDVTGAA